MGPARGNQINTKRTAAQLNSIQLSWTVPLGQRRRAGELSWLTARSARRKTSSFLQRQRRQRNEEEIKSNQSSSIRCHAKWAHWTIINQLTQHSIKDIWLIVECGLMIDVQWLSLIELLYWFLFILFLLFGWFSSSFQQTQLKSEFDWMKRANQAAPQAKSKQIKST